MPPELSARARDLIERGYQLQLEGQLDRAKDCYFASLALEPSAEAHTLLGCALSDEGRIDDAIAQCERAIALDPDLGDAWRDMGAYLLERGDEDLGRHFLERALEKKRFTHDHYAHLNLGRVYAKRGLLASALEELRRALDLEPRNRAARKALRELLRRFN